MALRAKRRGAVCWGNMTDGSDSSANIDIVGLRKRIRQLETQVDELRARDDKSNGDGIDPAVFRSILEYSDVAAALADLQGNMLYVNPTFAMMHGMDRKDAIGLNIMAFHGPSDEERAQELIGMVMRDGRFSNQEAMQVRTDGTTFPILLSCALMKDGSGQPRYMLATLVDISALKEAEEQLMFAQRGLDYSVDAAYWIDENGGLVYVNKSACDALGYERDELLAMSIFDVDRTVGPERYDEQWELLRESRTITIETTHTRKDGGTFRVEARVNFVKYGNRALACSLVRDITERKAVEEALRESEERFRAVVYGSPMGIHMYELRTDGSLVFSGANPAADKILGVDNAQFVGMTIEEAFPNLRETDLPDRYRNAASKGEGWFTEQVSYEDTRVVGVFEVRAFQTGPGRMAAFFLDVTDRKRMETRLRQAEKMEAIGQLAGGVAHDFNNQLTGVLGYAELITALSNDDQVNKLAGKIATTARRSADLTAQLLAFARKGQYRQEPVDVHAVLDEVVDLLRHSIDKRIRMESSFRADPAMTFGDETLLQNAFLNLGINARDAMPNGGLLRLETDLIELAPAALNQLGFQLERGKFVRVRVSDSGGGMNEETRKHIFEPFFTTKSRGKGTGMGLAAVYGAVRIHRGAIRVDSTLGQGSTFEVLLPLSDMNRAKKKRLPSTPPRHRGATILLVDDEQVVRDAMGEMLRGLGYQVETCTDGCEAVEKYRKCWKTIDLAIVDMVMPCMNGHDAFLAMREINPQLLALIASGYGLEGEPQKMLDAGIAGFLEKPIDLDELAARVSNALDERTRSRTKTDE